MNVLRIRNEMRNGKSIYDLPLRVTFYARVSTDKDEQINSLENQVQYYTELIQSKPNWTYVEGYIEGCVIIGQVLETLGAQGFALIGLCNYILISTEGDKRKQSKRVAGFDLFPARALKLQRRSEPLGKWRRQSLPGGFFNICVLQGEKRKWLLRSQI